MGIQDKINNAKEKNIEKGKGGWWLPESEENINELLENNDEKLYKTMLITGIEINTEGKFGDQYMIKFFDLDKYIENPDQKPVECLTPIRGNLASLIAKLSIGLEGSKMDWDNEEKKLHNEKVKDFMRENSFDDVTELQNLCFNIRYCGKLEIQSGKWKGQKSHSFTGEKINLEKEEVEDILNKSDLPF